MRRKTATSLALLIILTAAYTIIPANAQGSVNASIESSNINLNYHLILYENATTLSPSSFTLDSSNSSALVGLLQAAMQAKVPSIHLDQSSFRYQASIAQRPGSNTWVVSENMTGTVTGTTVGGTTGRASYDLDFLRMNVNESFQLGNVELNNVGSSYLVPPIVSQGPSTTFYLDRNLVRGGPYLTSVIPGNTTQSFNLLDFTWVPKISDWPHTYKPLDPSSSFSLDPKIDSLALPYNLTMGVKSPEGTFLTSLVAVYSPSLEITAPSRAVADGYTISYDLPTATDLVMPLIIVAVVALLLFALVFERRVSKTTVQQKKRDLKASHR